MSKVIDNRVVSMEFDNSQFEKNVQTSMKTLDSLNKTLDNLPETSGKKMFSGLSKAAGNIDLSGISSGIDTLNSKFSTLGIAGQEVIRGITRSAMQFGKNVWNMTFGQITSGGKGRADKIAQAKFSLEGMGKSWEEYADDIDYAVGGTAYGLDAAAGAAAQFATAGVKAGDDMKKALRGISGTAAMANTTFEDMADVFTQVASMHKVTGDTLNRLSARNIDALSILSKHLGKTSEETRKMVSKGQVDFATFAQAMDDAFGEHAKEADRTFSGVTANIRSALSKIGALFYQPLRDNDSNVVKMLESLKNKLNEFKNLLAPTAEVITNSILDVAKRVKLLIEAFDVNKLKPFLDSISSLVKNANIGLSFSNIIGGIKGVLKALEPLKKAAKDAFSEVFPKKFDAGTAIYEFSKKIAKFGKYFKISSDTVDKSKRIFKGAFSAISLGIKIFKDLLKSLSPVSDILKDIGSVIFDLAARIGDFFTTLNQNWGQMRPLEALKEALKVFEVDIDTSKFEGALGKLFEAFDHLKTLKSLEGDGLSGIIGVAFDVISDGLYKLSDAMRNLGLDGLADKFYDLGVSLQNTKNKVKEFVETFTLRDTIAHIKEELSNLEIGEKFAKAFQKVGAVFKAIGQVAGKVFAPVIDILKSFKDAFVEALSMPGGLTNLAAMMVIFEHFRRKLQLLIVKGKKIGDFIERFTGAGLGGKLTDVLGSINGYIINLSNNAKSDVILKCAAAIAILAISLKLIATIPTDKLLAAGTAVTIMVGGIVKAMQALNSMTSDTKGITGFKNNLSQAVGSLSKISENYKLSTLGTTMIKLAAAILILCLALKMLSDIDYGHLIVGTIAIGAFMYMLYKLTEAISNFDFSQIEKIKRIAPSLLILSIAIKVLASSMEYFKGMQWENVIQGLVSIAVMMGVLVGAVWAIDKFIKGETFTKIAAGMLIIAVAVKVLASALTAVAKVPVEQIASAFLAIIGLMAMLTLMAAAIDQFVGSGDFLKSAAGMLALAVAVGILAHALKTITELDPDRLGASIAILAIMMGTMVVACMLLQDALLKAGAGFLLVAVGMLVLVGAIQMMGSMDLGVLVQGMIAVGAALLIFGAALYFMSGSIVGAAALLIVAVALIPFALALKMLTDLNLADLAGTILVLVVALAALTVVCYALSGGLIGAAALLVLSAALVVFSVACAMLTALPLGDLAGTLLVLLAALIAFSVVASVLSLLSPLIVVFSAAMIALGAALVVISASVYTFGLGMAMLATSGEMGTMALMTFCTVIGKHMKDMTKAATVFAALGAALLVLDAGLVVAAVSIAACAVALTLLTGAMVLFSVAAVGFSAAILLVTSSLKVGIENLRKMLSEGEFKKMAGNAMTGIVKGIKEGITKAVEAAAELGRQVINKIKNFFGGGADSEMGKAGANGVMGFVAGIKSKLASVKQAAASIGNSLISKLKSSLKIKSPSRVTMEIGKYVDEGLAIGIDKNANRVTSAAEDMADETVDAMSGALSIISDAMGEDTNPTITPELDLSNVQNGVNSMHNMLNQRQAANISANYSAARMAEMEQMSFNQAQLASLGSQIGVLSGILANQPTPEVIANVNLVGDAAGVFRQVRNQNNVYTKMHGKSAFA